MIIDALSIYSAAFKERAITFMHKALEDKALQVNMIKPYSTRPLSSDAKKQGFCFTCAAIATTEALFQGDGVIIEQRYCNACFRTAER